MSKNRYYASRKIAALHVKRYHLYKKIARDQRGEYGEATGRYYYQLGWYDVIRVVVNYWKEFSPIKAKVVLAVLGIEPERVKSLPSVVEIAMHSNYAASTVYNMLNQFYDDVYQIAVGKGLVKVPADVIKSPSVK